MFSTSNTYIFSLPILEIQIFEKIDTPYYIVSCKDDIYNNMYNNVMQDTQEVFEAGDDIRKVSK